MRWALAASYLYCDSSTAQHTPSPEATERTYYCGNMTRTSVARTAVASAVVLPVLAVLAGATPALAATSGWRGSRLSLLGNLGVFIGIPIGLFAVITLLFVVLPSRVRQQRRNHHE